MIAFGGFPSTTGLDFRVPNNTLSSYRAPYKSNKNIDIPISMRILVRLTN